MVNASSETVAAKEFPLKSFHTPIHFNCLSNAGKHDATPKGRRKNQ